MDTSLKAWLEYTDSQTRSTKRVEITDDKTPDLGDITISVKKYRDNFILRDSGSRIGAFLNDRQVTEAALTNFDQIRVGSSQFVFRAAYLSKTEQFAETVEKPTEKKTKLGWSSLNLGETWPAFALFFAICFSNLIYIAAVLFTATVALASFWIATQCRNAFTSNFKEGLVLTLTTSVPWTIIVTGLLYLVV